MSKKQVQAKSESQQEDLTPKIYLAYRKKCDQNGLQVSPLIKTKLQQAVQSGALQQFQTSETLGPNQARAFLDALLDLKYNKLKRFCVWKGEFGDEGLRILSKYLMNENSLQVLDLLDNGLTSLGCEFFGKALTNPEIRLRQIKLDNNMIGTEGLRRLALGLRQICTLDKLSLKYCNIDKDGARYIQQIIANINSRLRSLKLQGNPLQNQGSYKVLKAIRTCGQRIQKINIGDVKMNLLGYSRERSGQIEYKIKDELMGIIKNSMVLVKFEIRYNQIHDEIGQEILRVVEENRGIRKMWLPGNVRYELREGLEDLMRARNKKGKVGKGKGKGKGK